MTTVDTNHYAAPTEIKEIKVINTYELEAEARKIVPKGGFDYMSGASGDEFTLRQNNEAWNKKGILPRVLADVENPNTSTSIFGHDIKVPFIMAPIAAHGLAHQTKEAGTAKGVAEFGTIMTIIAYLRTKFEEIEEVLNSYLR